MDHNHLNQPAYHILRQLIVQEARRRLLQESIPRLRRCLDLLGEDDIWYQPNAHSNSVGNLIIHLHGNVRQWLGTGLAKLADVREREEEFEQHPHLPKQAMYDSLDTTARIIEKVLDQVTPGDLTATHYVQGYHETGLGIIVHVIEHFSYHVGQVTYFTKARLDLDTGYYEGQDLNVTG